MNRSINLCGDGIYRISASHYSADCILGNFSKILLSPDFFKIKVFINSFRNSIRVSNSLDPDQAKHFGPDLGQNFTGPRNAVGTVSGYRCVSDCRSRGSEFDPGPVPYFRGD